MKPKANANPILAIIVIVLCTLLGFSIVLNVWISTEFLHLSKEYKALSEKPKGDDENADKEIERKWLVDPSKIPYNLEKDADKFELTQTYLNYSPEIRVRNISDKRYVMAVKTGLTETSGLKRTEHQYDITKEEYEHLLTKKQGDTIYKTRYQIKVDGRTHSFDFFHKQLDGLVYMEIEFPTEEEANAFEAPEWLGKDVTNEKKYKNQSLAQYGIPESYKEDLKQ